VAVSVVVFAGSAGVDARRSLVLIDETRYEIARLLSVT
jgi:hypothetical protein